MLFRLLPLFVLLSCGVRKMPTEAPVVPAPAPVTVKEPAPALPPPLPPAEVPTPAKAEAPSAPTVTAPAAANEPAPPPPAEAPAAAKPAAPAPKQLRVHIIGASVSGGFEDSPLTGAKEQGESVTLQQLLKGWAGDDARVSAHNALRMQGMFTEPEKIGAEQLAGVQKAKPDVLIAIDFPFWFAYGYVQGDEGPARRQRFAEGLAMLDKLAMPILLGDLPDMHGAATRMLKPRQIPEAGLLRQLNEQLAAFVKAHSNMHLVQLSVMVRTMKDEGVVLPLATGGVKTPPGALLQEDRLHATRLGMAFLGHAIQEDLRRSFPDGHPLRARQWTFEQFVAAAGAEDDLAAVVAAAKGAKAAPAGVGK